MAMNSKCKDTYMKGYKVFNPDWTCYGKQYTCPGKFEEDVDLKASKRGMHFCRRVANCFSYYNFDPENHVAEVVAYGEVEEKGDQCRTDKLEVVREIPWADVLDMVNTGQGNSGFRNGGNFNSGDFNSGNFNSGNRNSGNRNSGNGNSGDFNSGDFNSGDFNSGNCNSGEWNECDHSDGCFNTIEPKIYLFNKPSEWTYGDWFVSEARELLKQFSVYSTPTELATTNEYAVAWWNRLTDEEKNVITSIPNFDAEIFKQITGVDVR